MTNTLGCPRFIEFTDDMGTHHHLPVEDPDDYVPTFHEWYGRTDDDYEAIEE
jgi:hypothetical protein